MQTIELLESDAARRQKEIIFILMPVNSDVMGRLLPGVMQQIKTRSDAVATQLEKRGANVLNLTTQTRGGAFSDAWCACGHLQQAGRQQVAKAAAQATFARRPLQPARELPARP